MGEYEIRIHGRGGQGTVLAANMLAAALVEEGKFVVAIPAFGFERRGAPVASFLRCDDREIRRFNNIYTPNCIICIDPTVSRVVDIFSGLKPEGVLVQATSRGLDELELPENVRTVGICDAVALAQKVFMKPITNTIMLGAFAKATGMVSLESLKKSLEHSDFRDAGLAQNLTALTLGYNHTTVHHVERKAA